MTNHPKPDHKAARSLGQLPGAPTNLNGDRFMDDHPKPEAQNEELRKQILQTITRNPVMPMKATNEILSLVAAHTKQAYDKGYVDGVNDVQKGKPAEVVKNLVAIKRRMYAQPSEKAGQDG